MLSSLEANPKSRREHFVLCRFVLQAVGRSCFPLVTKQMKSGNSGERHTEKVKVATREQLRELTVSKPDFGGKKIDFSVVL